MGRTCNVLPDDQALCGAKSAGFLPRSFDEAQGGRASEDVDGYIRATPLGDLCLLVKSLIFHVVEEVTSKC